MQGISRQSKINSSYLRQRRSIFCRGLPENPNGFSRNGEIAEFGAGGEKGILFLKKLRYACFRSGFNGRIENAQTLEAWSGWGITKETAAHALFYRNCGCALFSKETALRLFC